jgi:hypothetical protein
MQTRIHSFIDDYLRDLKKALKGCDHALIQDALSDAEEYLRHEMENIRRSDSSLTNGETLQSIILEKYGDPGEIASAYRESEPRFVKFAPPPQPGAGRFSLERLYGILADPRAWGAFLYMLLGLVFTACGASWASHFLCCPSS